MKNKNCQALRSQPSLGWIRCWLRYEHRCGCSQWVSNRIQENWSQFWRVFNQIAICSWFRFAVTFPYVAWALLPSHSLTNAFNDPSKIYEPFGVETVLKWVSKFISQLFRRKWDLFQMWVISRERNNKSIGLESCRLKNNNNFRTLMSITIAKPALRMNDEIKSEFLKNKRDDGKKIINWRFVLSSWSIYRLRYGPGIDRDQAGQRPRSARLHNCASTVRTGQGTDSSFKKRIVH